MLQEEAGKDIRGSSNIKYPKDYIEDGENEDHHYYVTNQSNEINPYLSHMVQKCIVAKVNENSCVKLHKDYIQEIFAKFLKP